MRGIRQIICSALTKLHGQQNRMNSVNGFNVENQDDFFRELPTIQYQYFLKSNQAEENASVYSFSSLSSDQQRQRSRDLNDSLDSLDESPFPTRKQEMQIEFFNEMNGPTFFLQNQCIPRNNNSYLSASSTNSPNSTIQSMEMTQRIQNFELEPMDIEDSPCKQQSIDKKLRKVKYMKNIIKKSPLKKEKEYRGDYAYERVMSKTTNTTIQERSRDWRYLPENQKEQWKTLAKKLGLIKTN